MKNHLGSYECKLCLTLHNNEGSYLAHTQGKKHQANLARRAAKEAKESPQQNCSIGKHHSHPQLLSQLSILHYVVNCKADFSISPSFMFLKVVYS
ncbi:hypothetical protein L9F63_027674, partial [Diploptera punctata]